MRFLREHADHASHSFPGKLLDFTRAGLPVVIHAPSDSPAGRWALPRDWLLYIADEDDAAAFERVAASLADQAQWLEAQQRVMATGAGEFSAETIHGKLLEHLNSQPCG